MDIKGIKEKIEAGDIEGAKSMIEKRSDRINQPNQWKETCLMCVCYERNPVLIDLLIDAGADLGMTDLHGSTALHYAVTG
uniref:Uncharacterized protein n=1 Tax=Octopus bimaculoides TaxID=37653 RepID=A0A0L8FEX7_OCTBM